MTFELVDEWCLPQYLLISAVPGAGHFKNKIAVSLTTEKAA